MNGSVVSTLGKSERSIIKSLLVSLMEYYVNTNPLMETHSITFVKHSSKRSITSFQMYSISYSALKQFRCLKLH